MRNPSMIAILAAGLTTMFALTPALAGPGHPPAPAGPSGSGPHGTPAITGEEASRIVQCFGPKSQGAVTTLRDQHWGYGEIVSALFLAQHSGTSVNKIVAMRNANMGWGEIAMKLGLPPDTLGKAKKTCNTTQAR